MQRPIKFRAWDKSLEKMIKPFVFDDITAWQGGLSAGELDLERAEDYEILQYTGLKDKNGVEIYEGDIVSAIEGNRVVEWGFTSADGEALGYAIYGIDEDTEVIGNIYENPELLEDKK